jgi:hypothetical protein
VSEGKRDRGIERKREGARGERETERKRDREKERWREINCEI